MKRFAALALAAVIATPALAQQGATQIEVEARPVIDQWIERFNRGDAAGLFRVGEGQSRGFALPDVRTGRGVAHHIALHIHEREEVHRFVEVRRGGNRRRLYRL